MTLTVSAGGPVAEPTQVVWAWKRAESLPFLQAGRHEVAWFAAELQIDGTSFRMGRRRNPLHVPEGVTRTLVAHIDILRRQPPVLDEPLREAMLDALVTVAALDPAATLQIDFEPRRSERAFYGELLRQLRLRLPQRRLSITALTSWCWGDRWLADLPVDEVVPMLFRMGREGWAIREQLAAGQWPPEPLCRQAAGVALDELPPGLPPFGRLYWFAPRSWRVADWQTAQQSLERWRSVDASQKRQ
ncbi:hypothetical protein [Chitinimonas lacunae]|uniref:Uncharacterized protein n=1 Tax=Chitinimonas lacunae TaxID=1963018 RepID=A0ABV8MVX7_9NEIS